MKPGLSSLIGQHFAYANGRICVLQQLLMEQTDVDRLLGAHSEQECEKILTELKFTNIIDQGLSKGNEILNALESWVRDEVDQMSPPEKRVTFHILWITGDAPLLKYLLKKHHGLTADKSEEPVSGFHAYDPDVLRALVLEGVEGALPLHLVHFVQEIRVKENLTPQEIDTAVAQYVANTQLKLARASGSIDIRDFVQHAIDLQNIRTALRIHEESKESSLPFLLDGGTISTEELAGSIEEIRAAVDRSPIAFTLTSDLIERGEDPSALERELSHVQASDIARMWNVPMSIEPLFAFSAIALSQLTLIRVILIGKRNGLSPQEIKKMLPPFLSPMHYLP